MASSMRAWYEVGGSVDLIGFHPDWPDVYTDPLVIYPIGVTFDEYQEWRHYVAENGPEEIGPFGAAIAPVGRLSRLRRPAPDEPAASRGGRGDAAGTPGPTDVGFVADLGVINAFSPHRFSL